MSAQQIVKIAVNSIPQNYPIQHFGLVGYYRDYQVKNSKYTNLNEAIIKVKDGGFLQKNNYDNDYQLVYYNRNKDFEIDFLAKQPYDYKKMNKIVPNARMENEGGNEFMTLIIHDAIRNYERESFSFIDNMASDFVETHRFQLRGTTNFKKEKVYEIYFNYKNADYAADGTIYINVDDFAILKLDYFVYRSSGKPREFNAINGFERFSDGFKKMDRELLYHIQTEYMRGFENKLFLNYISFYNKILIRRPVDFTSKFVIDLKDSIFKIQVNKIPNGLEKIKQGDFKIRYKNKLLPIKDFYFLENQRAFVINPDLQDTKARKLLAELFEEKENLQVSEVEYTYGNIRDSLGNKLDERKWQYIHQYREFFTQEITQVGDLMVEKDLMIKTLPLDSPSQLISKGDMKNDYWMNTPLPGLEP